MLKENTSLVLQDDNIGVKIDPNVKTMRRVRILMLISIILLTLSTGFTFVSDLYRSHGTSFNVFNDFYSLLSIIFIIVYVSWVGRYWKRLEQKRQAAAHGNRQLLADEQPVADEQALTLPLTVAQRPNWKILLLFPVIMLVTAVVAFFVMAIFHSDGHPLSFMAIGIGIGITLFLVLVYGAIIFAILYRKAREQITLTESGLLQVGVSTKVKSIPWSEARLFAIDNVFGAKKYPKPTIFELSSANEMIRWGWMRQNNMRMLSLARPTVSPEEYEQMMNGVLAVIAAKTGLSLYDLRKDEAK